MDRWSGRTGLVQLLTQRDAPGLQGGGRKGGGKEGMKEPLWLFLIIAQNPLIY